MVDKFREAFERRNPRRVIRTVEELKPGIFLVKFFEGPTGKVERVSLLNYSPSTDQLSWAGNITYRRSRGQVAVWARFDAQLSSYNFDAVMPLSQRDEAVDFLRYLGVRYG